MTAPNRGAMGILATRGFLRGSTVYCPHELSRRGNAILVHGFHRDMVMCELCLRTMQELGDGYRMRQLGPRVIVARMLDLGYTRRDAAGFILELAAERLGVPLGIRRAVFR